MFWDRGTWSKGTPLVEVETVNDLKKDEGGNWYSPTLDEDYWAGLR